MVQNHNNNKEQNNYSYNNNYVNKNHLSIMQTNKPIKRVCVYVCCRSPCGGRRHNVCPQYQFGFGSSHGTYAKKIYQLKTFYKPKKKWKHLFFCLKNKSKVNQKKSISSTSRQLLNLPLFVCLSLSLPNYQPVPITLSLLLLLPLSLSLSLFALALHTICVTFVHISFRFSSQKKKHNHCVEISFHFIVDFLHSFWNKANCKITNAYTPIIQYILIYKHILKFLPIKCCVNNCFAMPCQFVIAPK